MAWFTLAILAYPETQARAQAELDAVVGRTRLPTFADYTHLPYIRAMVKEALRWRPVDPVGLPHRSIEDDWYEGMFIPKGTVCIANVWHLNRDPEIYGEDAAHFNPARHLDANGNTVLRQGRRTQRKKATLRMVLAAGCVSVAMWQTIRCSSTLRSCFGQPRSNARKIVQADCFP